MYTSKYALEYDVLNSAFHVKSEKKGCPVNRASYYCYSCSKLHNILPKMSLDIRPSSGNIECALCAPHKLVS